MTIRNLSFLLNPRSVAVVGATPRLHAVGQVVLDNILAGGFHGPIYPINPKHQEIASLKTYASIETLPEVPDLAVIATPADTVPGLVAKLGERGTRAVVVLTAGFSEGDSAGGKSLAHALLDAARPSLTRILGPNCFGLMISGIGLNASFARTPPLTGHLALIAQSGAIVSSMLDWARPRGIGFSHVVTLGDMIDVDFGDMLDCLCNDLAVRAILLYIEGITHPRKFMSAARAAARIKPVIVVKGGRFAASAKAAASHTGALAGADAVYDAAFARAGILRVHSLDDLFAASAVLALSPGGYGDRLSIVTNGGGFGVLAADELLDRGGRLATLSPQTRAALEACLPPTWSHDNPIDIIGDAGAERYMAALDAALSDSECDAVLVMHCPTAIVDPIDAAAAVAESRKRHPKLPLLTAWLGEQSMAPARKLFAAQGIASFESPAEAVSGFMHIVHYGKLRDLLMEAPPAPAEVPPAMVEEARRLVKSGLTAGPGWLPPTTSRRLISLYGISSPRMEMVKTPAEAAAAVARFSGLVALKIVSPISCTRVI